MKNWSFKRWGSLFIYLKCSHSFTEQTLIEWHHGRADAKNRDSFMLILGFFFFETCIFPLEHVPFGVKISCIPSERQSRAMTMSGGSGVCAATLPPSPPALWPVPQKSLSSVFTPVRWEWWQHLVQRELPIKHYLPTPFLPIPIGQENFIPSSSYHLHDKTNRLIFFHFQI